MLFGDNYSLAFVEQPSRASAPGSQRGEMRMSEDTFTPEAVATAGETVLMQRIPEGARIVDVQVFNAASNASPVGGAVSVGWTESVDPIPSGSTVGLVREAENATGFFSNLDISTNASIAKLSDGDPAALPAGQLTEGFGRTFGSDVHLMLTVTTDTVAVDGSQLTVRVFYVED